MERIIDDPLRTLAYGTDASFYRYSACFMTHSLYSISIYSRCSQIFFLTRLIPKIVVQVESEEEVQKIILLSNETKIPITFRAAGTSLSGFFFKILQN